MDVSGKKSRDSLRLFSSSLSCAKPERHADLLEPDARVHVLLERCASQLIAHQWHNNQWHTSVRSLRDRPRASMREKSGETAGR